MSKSKLALHFYISSPISISDSVFKQQVDALYSPLVKLFKNTKDLKFSLSISLGALEQFERFGYQTLINDFRTLINENRIELVVCPAYNSSVSSVGLEFFQKQLILNEYALGYYFGLNQSFEGDPAILIRDIEGVYLPNDLLTSSTLFMLDELGYKWVKDISSFQSPSKNSELICYYDRISYLTEERSLSTTINAYLTSKNTQDLNNIFQTDFEYNFISLNILDLYLKNNDLVYSISKLLEYLSANSVEYMTIGGVNMECLDESFFTTGSVATLPLVEPDVLANADKTNGGVLNTTPLILNYIAKHVEKATFTQISGFENLAIWQDKVLDSVQRDDIKCFIFLSKLSDMVTLNSPLLNLSRYCLDLLHFVASYYNDNSTLELLNSVK